MQRDVNSLTDENRATRKRALGRLCKEMDSHGSNKDVFSGLFQFLLKPVLKMFSDPVESCRAGSIEFFSKYVCAYASVLRRNMPTLFRLVPIAFDYIYI